MSRWMIGLLQVVACAAQPAGRPAGPTEAPSSAGPLPGSGAQHHATVACVDGRCAVARQAGGRVLISALDPDGAPISQHTPPSPPNGWNHPQIAPWGDGWLLLAATSGAPTAVALDATGSPTSELMTQHEPWPWGLWPDLALGEDGRALAVWGTKTTPWWRVFDPETNAGAPAASWDFAWPQATIDPPAAVAVPGGYVRAWTEKNGFVWELRLAWLDADGQPLGDPVVAAAGEGLSRGTRPQVAAAPDGTIAVVWRIWADLGLLPDGAFLRVYAPDASPVEAAQRLDRAHGDRPVVARLPDGWLVAWEEDAPTAVYQQAFDHAGAPLAAPERMAENEAPCGRADLAVEATDDGWHGLLSWEVVYDETGDQVVDSDVWVQPIGAAR